MSLSIRKALISDAELLSNMEEKCFSKPWSEESIAHHMENGAFFFIAEEDNVPLGYAGMEIVFDEVNIYNIAVLKEHRRRGIGRALVNKLIDTAKEKGALAMYLEVRHRNLAAIELYESVGFTFIGLRKNYYQNPTDNALLYRLSLTGEEEDYSPDGE